MVCRFCTSPADSAVMSSYWAPAVAVLPLLAGWSRSSLTFVLIGIFAILTSFGWRMYGHRKRLLAYAALRTELATAPVATLERSPPFLAAAQYDTLLDAASDAARACDSERFALLFRAFAVKLTELSRGNSSVSARLKRHNTMPQSKSGWVRMFLFGPASAAAPASKLKRKPKKSTATNTTASDATDFAGELYVQLLRVVVEPFLTPAYREQIEQLETTTTPASPPPPPAPPLVRQSSNPARALAVPPTPELDRRLAPTLYMLEACLADRPNHLASPAAVRRCTEYACVLAYTTQYYIRTIFNPICGIVVREVSELILSYLTLWSDGRSDTWAVCALFGDTSTQIANYVSPALSPELFHRHVGLATRDPDPRVLPATGRPFDPRDAEWRKQCAPLIRSWLMTGVGLIVSYSSKHWALAVECGVLPLDTMWTIDANGDVYGMAAMHDDAQLIRLAPPATGVSSSASSSDGGGGGGGGVAFVDSVHRFWSSDMIQNWHNTTVSPDARARVGYGEVLHAKRHSPSRVAFAKRRRQWASHDPNFYFAYFMAQLIEPAAITDSSLHDPMKSQVLPICDPNWVPTLTDTLHAHHICYRVPPPRKTEYSVSPAGGSSGARDASTRVLPVTIYDWPNLYTASGSSAAIFFLNLLWFGEAEQAQLINIIRRIREWGERSRGACEPDLILVATHAREHKRVRKPPKTADATASASSDDDEKRPPRNTTDSPILTSAPRDATATRISQLDYLARLIAQEQKISNDFATTPETDNGEWGSFANHEPIVAIVKSLYRGAVYGYTVDLGTESGGRALVDSILSRKSFVFSFT